MPQDTSAAHLELLPGRALTLAERTGDCLKALEGTLWITLGDHEDIVLPAGRTLGLDPLARPVVTALGGAARFALVACPEPARAA
jgi:hypothetical protein